MNLRIVSFLSSDSEEEVKELVADFAEALLKEDLQMTLKILLLL
jgi:hypothetical protein